MLSFATGHVPHTAKAGTEVGTLTAGEGGAVKVPVTLQKDLTEPGLVDTSCSASADPRFAAARR
ncbi:hypothetical protein AB0N88_20535 [Streptomyces sp. NPDC093516]|uniref:hypothetical protein n=1 Tax=Streptomyces sp. NPDC093516 TaxID=3155304 RepID=UPI003439C255